jgi:galactosamine-6-phosphate isomerase
MGLTQLMERDYDAMSRRAAELIVAAVRARPDLLLCTATGSSPTRAYELLAERHRREPALFSRLRLMKLDEWGGLPPDDPGTCESYLRGHLVDPLNIPVDRYYTFRGDAPDAGAECRNIERALSRLGPIHLCVLGLGVNGHLGFNEPADTLHPGPHGAPLTEESLAHPMVRHARGHVRYGLTLGMGDILRSEKILLLVSGCHKREPLRRLLIPKVSTRFPASFLWLHRDVTVLCDAEASDAHGPQ